MSIEQIRRSRNVPAKVGGRVIYTGDQSGTPKGGTIVGSRDGYLRIRLDGATLIGSYHPTWELTYLEPTE